MAWLEEVVAEARGGISNLAKQGQGQGQEQTLEEVEVVHTRKEEANEQSSEEHQRGGILNHRVVHPSIVNWADEIADASASTPVPVTRRRFLIAHPAASRPLNAECD